MWSPIQQSFVDESMNSQNWPEELQKHMYNAYMYGQNNEDPDRQEKAWGEVDELLKSLGDPYTHRVLPNDFAQFKVSSDGELQGVGLLLAVGNNQNVEGHLRVLAPIRGGPADRAGILPGDEVLSIDGKDTTGWNGATASQNLRGMGGTQVHVKLARRTDQIPGEPGTPEPPVPHIVYKSQGISRYIMDLRSNPGGLVRSGIDMVAMWLDGDKRVFNVESRDGIEQTQTTMTGKPALTHDPLVVLVNSSSASASEIVSGALHDNGRAVIMGDSNTYGKGRIQTVFPLQDGSALFVTVAQYQTPDGTVIDLKGLKPDRSCKLPTSLASLPAPPLKGEGTSPSGVLGTTATPPGPPGQSGKGDGFLPGVPLDPVTERVLLEALQKDQCIAAAEQFLDSAEGSKRGIM
ncbi:C-terminal processing peptidase [Dunaliella salina]|uniref:C-terminal processing peptidase n=1 Tax=Dunaliella salina TaxID=3046 RepID=A0ABQ7H848_DUNSA|nr:C-terminal processing peptidase [Dunaliella salina]|eukprot:KAF5843029.1 C-terminal processing peptidase [Dunaliella salina]